MLHCEAEELKIMNKKQNTNNKTHWKSILFMVWSIFKMSPEEMRTIRNKMPSLTA